MTPDDLMTLTLQDGLPVQREGKTVRYRKVELREITYADELEAVRLAERMVMHNSRPVLLVSDATFKAALTARHIRRFFGELGEIGQDLIDMDLVGRLSRADMSAIEERVFVVELAAQVRYGKITQADFDKLFEAMGKPQEAPPAPQPLGPAGDAAGSTADAGAGPVVLASHAVARAAGPA